MNRDNFTEDYIRELQKRSGRDPGLLERTLFAFGLLDALAAVGLPFVFKGGTCLMLLLRHLRRLSTDIDIVVKPGTDIDAYVEKAARLFPFVSKDEQRRTGRNKIEKRHFKFSYMSPVRKAPFYILLDVLFEENNYPVCTRGPIANELLLPETAPLEVVMPSLDCILADKLTAFAPHTIGIPFGDKDLEVVKQFYDVVTLTEEFSDIKLVEECYRRLQPQEAAYRGLSITPEETLLDSYESAYCLAAKGKVSPDDFRHLVSGARGIQGHIFSEKYSAEIAASQVPQVMYLVHCLLHRLPFAHPRESSASGASFRHAELRVFKSLRTLAPVPYAYALQLDAALP